jgi:hypothetical protein
MTDSSTPGPPDDEPSPEVEFDSLDAPLSPVTGRRLRRTRLLSALVVVGVIAVSTGGLVWTDHSSSRAPKVTIRGTIILTNSATLRANCIGQGGYRDLRAGAAVVLTNEAGETIGSAKLQDGEPDYDDGICSYPFTIVGVPSNQQQYAVEVARRGKVLKSQAEMKRTGWTYFLALT